MSIPSWAMATWGEIFSGKLGEKDQNGEIQTPEQKRRVFEASVAQATCEGLTRDELNNMISSVKGSLTKDLYWWLHEYSAEEFATLQDLGGCPPEQVTPVAVVDTQVAAAVEAEAQAQRRWTIGVGIGAAVLVAAAAWALWPRKTRALRRRRR